MGVNDGIERHGCGPDGVIPAAPADLLVRRPPGRWYVLDFARGRPANPMRDTGRPKRPPVSFPAADRMSPGVGTPRSPARRKLVRLTAGTARRHRRSGHAGRNGTPAEKRSAEALHSGIGLFRERRRGGRFFRRRMRRRGRRCGPPGRGAPLARRCLRRRCRPPISACSPAAQPAGHSLRSSQRAVERRHGVGKIHALVRLPGPQGPEPHRDQALHAEFAAQPARY